MALLMSPHPVCHQPGHSCPASVHAAHRCHAAMISCTQSCTQNCSLLKVAVLDRVHTSGSCISITDGQDSRAQAARSRKPNHGLSACRSSTTTWRSSAWPSSWGWRCPASGACAGCTAAGASQRTASAGRRATVAQVRAATVRSARASCRILGVSTRCMEVRGAERAAGMSGRGVCRRAGGSAQALTALCCAAMQATFRRCSWCRRTSR